jgi:diacylglycerol kinase
MEERNKTKRVKRSFVDAFNGFFFALKTEVNFQIEIVLAAIAIVLMIFFRVTGTEALALILIMATVLLAELINTAVERMMDIVHPEQHPYVKNVKDLMAASVLVASIAALALGLVIFIPYIYSHV